MADARLFAKLDLGYFDNPKVADFIEDHPHVLFLHLRAILYCRQHLTDGHFPVRLVVRMASASYCGSECEAECDYCRAVGAGLIERVDARTGNVHDYLEHQDSAEQVQRRSHAGKKGAEARWSDSDADRNANGNATGNAKANAEERRGEERRAKVASAPAAPARDSSRAASGGDRFPEFWGLYPRKKDRGHALKAWNKAVRTTDPQVIIDGLTSQLPAMTKSDQSFIPYGATWLNGERWADEITEARRTTGEWWSA